MSGKKRRKQNPVVPAVPAAEPPPQEPGAARVHDGFFFTVLAVAVIVRFLFLGRAELWQDELGFLNLAHPRLSSAAIWRSGWETIVSIGQLPLSFLIFNAFYRIIGLFTGPVGAFTPALARLPAVVFGIIGVWSGYRLSARVLDRPVARLNILIMALFFFPVYYSREAYCYAQIIALSPLVLCSITRIVFERKRSRIGLIFLFVFLTALLYSHLSALMIVVPVSLCIFLLWTNSRTKDEETARGAFAVGVVCGLSLLTIAPYAIRFALENKAHTGGADYSLLVILNDVVCKLFLGERPWAVIVSWTVFVAGVVSLLLPNPKSAPRRFLVSVTVLGLLAITWATHRSQYLSARYFSPVSPLVLIVMGQGVYQLALWLSRLVRLPEPRKAYVFYSLAALPLAIHAFAYTPALLRLTEKSTPFGAVAKWINENLAPGTPYLMESAYEIRWVGGSYPTPDRHPASPYVHSSAPNEMTRLHDKQIEFMNRFPEAPFIESAHHNWDQPGGLWTWPHRNFRQHIVVGNPEKLKRLIRWGIYPGVPHESLSEYSYRIDIYYNTLEDRMELARQRGKPALPVFDGWEIQGQPIGPQETLYFRVQRGANGAFRLAGTSDVAAEGSLRISGALPGPAGRTTTLALFLGEKPLHQAQVRTGQPIELEVPAVRLPPGDNTIRWERASDSSMAAGMIVLDADWGPARTTAQPTASGIPGALQVTP
ncbi:MAG: hypothetical protein BWY59_02071 [Verrucomicrobia bacterium ADurb.Bin345]|nr:MAG: hypothetical protein BWY59_02071 [Verrucomicrobia bacterium ADurb.Bin345]